MLSPRPRRAGFKVDYRNPSLIDQSRTLMVNFNQFGASSLDFFIYGLTRTIVWAEFLAVK
jgi:MscS family membrane protein